MTKTRTIRVTEDIWYFLKKKASTEKKSMLELIKELLDKKYAKEIR